VSKAATAAAALAIFSLAPPDIPLKCPLRKSRIFKEKTLVFSLILRYQNYMSTFLFNLSICAAIILMPILGHAWVSPHLPMAGFCR
jgi:hypothetical protein